MSSVAPPETLPIPPRSVAQIVLSIDRGGLERMAASLALGLHARGIRSSVIALDEGGEHLEALESAGVECTVLGGRRPWSAGFHRELAAALRRSEVEVAHTHHFSPLLHSLPGRHLARTARLVHTEHSYEYLLQRRDYRLTLRAMSSECSAFVVCGERMRPYYRAHVGVSDARLRVIPNGIDVSSFTPVADRSHLRASLGLPGGILIGVAARLAPEKNFSLLLRGFAAARCAREDLSLILVGEGEEREALEGLASELGVRDSVHFLGWRSDVQRIVAALDLFVVSSLHEALPLAVLEAMACGVPVVATPVGDLPEVVRDGETGILFPSQDTPALATALLSLAGDPQRRSAMGLAARETVLARYSLEAMVDSYVGLYSRSRERAR